MYLFMSLFLIIFFKKSYTFQNANRNVKQTVCEKYYFIEKKENRKFKLYQYDQNLGFEKKYFKNNFQFLRRQPLKKPQKE